MNRLYTLIFILFTFLFVTAFSEEDLIPVKQVTANLLKIRKVGDNKLIAEVTWDGTLERDDEPVKTKFRCFSDAVTVKGPKHGVFGDRKVNFELKVHKKNVNVKCRFGIFDIDSFKNIISFRT
ncbi:uncharacterized protein OCT59_019831 [Rhizophagus irregularis]|uniref:Uncharacterized protein n=3 Tax=Rhizophagus irregularis TaxID=588596 RepID=A0A916E7M1_9GLOM|nr:hypothetical protein GLOIN_2v1793426 [Rhizophagus irregularis DAOM 181602=DAOM 197198]UZO27641.1 hypothetical protein OCT59_019831 [Rhizophagus irregularis]POG71655.1 hypothetical protein GLOIN_2v1793426 [Rhizophagus irregularis DAOM 181602=DAOM 197198]CAB4482352.1 unnamed protein product [Rhizophagus irregularis]CAB5187519.1 unnamed protein product [Rhizophagus irregularis]CAB5367108.1 unnamed protein product [Rhizophagus irregularis]|eukprot:XP_025178521.1 hypothetical protein GLOIN_2v1793426 [Rhizophagus irregularis DAOM 181602=DAOM 197198]